MTRYVPRVTKPLSTQSLSREGQRIARQRVMGDKITKADWRFLATLPRKIPFSDTEPELFKSACILARFGYATYDDNTKILSPTVTQSRSCCATTPSEQETP